MRKTLDLTNYASNTMETSHQWIALEWLISKVDDDDDDDDYCTKLRPLALVLEKCRITIMRYSMTLLFTLATYRTVSVVSSNPGCNNISSETHI